MVYYYFTHIKQDIDKNILYVRANLFISLKGVSRTMGWQEMSTTGDTSCVPPPWGQHDKVHGWVQLSQCCWGCIQLLLRTDLQKGAPSKGEVLHIGYTETYI